MSIQTLASPRSIALGAMLLLLAATASSCGMALPTQPALDSGVATTRHAATTTMQEAGGSVQIDDATNPSGGPDITNQPPAGEVVIPTPGSILNGTRTGWWNNVHRRHNK